MTQPSPPPVDLSRIARVLQPIAQASGLPNEAYTSAAHFEFERDQVIGRSWAGLAFSDAVAARPRAVPVEFMGLPLLLTRDKAGVLRVFHNVCSHRGMKLVHEPTDVQGVIRCPYHSWTYEPGGTLKGTPHIGGVGQHRCEGFDLSAHGLKPVRSAEFMGVVFINLSGDAPPFDSFIAPLQQRAERFIGAAGWAQLAVGSSGARLSMEINANWKLAVENYCEAYHLPWVHPGLNDYSKLEDHYCFTDATGFAGQGSSAYRLSEVAGTQLPRLAAWPQDRLSHAEYPSLYPNVLLGFQADHCFALIVSPLAPARSREELRLFYVGPGAQDEAYHGSREATLEAWRVVFGEDVFAVEGMQAGRASPGYRGGVFSPVMDQPTHHFHQWVATRLMERGAA